MSPITSLKVGDRLLREGQLWTVDDSSNSDSVRIVRMSDGVVMHVESYALRGLPLWRDVDGVEVRVREEDAVDHPRHYNAHPSGIEAIVLCERMSFCLGNAVKYLIRREHKGALIEDVRKARWYCARAEKSPREMGIQLDGREDLIDLARDVAEHEPMNVGRAIFCIVKGYIEGHRGSLVEALACLDREIARLEKMAPREAKP